MLKNFDNCKITFFDKILQKDNHTYPQTVVIEFFENGKEIKNVEYGFLPIIEIYKLIEKQEPIILDHCYIKNFSLTQYRSLHNFKHDDDVFLKRFSANEAFFDGRNDNGESVGTDFSSAIFAEETISFANAIFAFGPTNFQDSILGHGEKNFEAVLFLDGNISFFKTNFGEGDVNFKLAFFREGVKNFEHADFGEGQVIFQKTEFGKGGLSFANANFNDGKTSFKEARFGDGDVDFHYANFGDGEVTFEKAEFGDGEVNFRSTKFGNGKVDFTRCEFGDGEVNFTNAEFGNGNVYFVNSNFQSGKASFKLATFGTGKKDFHYAKFGEGDKNFERTNFGAGDVDFRAVDFNEGRINFILAEFGDGDVTFEASELKKGKITFRRNAFGKGMINFAMAEFENAELIFENINFNQESVTFHRAKFNSLSIKSCQLDNYFDLRFLKCGILDLSDTIIRDIIDMTPYDFDMELKALNLSGVRLLGRIFIEWNTTNVKKLIYQQESSFRSKSEQFRILKQNYNSTGQYNDEDESYIEFKRTELEADLRDSIKKKRSKFRAYFHYWIQHFLFDKIGLYATNPIRVLVSMLIFYFAFSLLYIFLPDAHIESSLGDPEKLPYVAKCFYFSVVTFFTVGYGDYYPGGYLKIVAGIEGFCGVFLMSYFTVAFVRKILR